jgi:aminoglycoside phosphotransferase (APT) family kinase protein
MKSNWIKVEPLLKGWSDDKKFYIEDDLGEKFLLRIADECQYEAKRREYESIKRCFDLGIPTSKPIDLGFCLNKQKVYLLLTWVEGEDAETALPNYSLNEQYNLGVKAGHILRRIHSIPAREGEQHWGSRYKAKIEQKIKNYKNCSIKLESDENIIRFLKDNLSYLDNRPQTFHHGDYHVGNLVIKDKDNIGVIDFNRFDYGDPWEEFNRCVFSWKASVPFVTGQIHGYFNNNVSDEFFRLMALYVATNTISSIPWAIPFGEEEVAVMLSNGKDILQWYDGFKRYVPVWYKEPDNL